MELLESRRLLSTNPLSDGTVLWQIGKEDYSNAEFTGAQPTAYTIPSNWASRTSWPDFPPEILKSSGNSIDLNFTLASIPQYGVDFNFRSVQTSSGTPELDVYSNGELAGMIQTWGTSGFNSYSGDFQQDYHLYIPVQMLKTGANDLRMVISSGIYSSATAGSNLTFVGWDFLRLNALAAPAPEPVNGRVVYLGSNLEMGGDPGTTGTGADPNYNAFSITSDLVRLGPSLLKWMGIAYSGNTMRATLWSDVGSQQPAALQLLQMYQSMNMSVIADNLGANHVTLNPDGTLSTANQQTLNQFFATYGNLIQYYETSNEPVNAGGSAADVDALAQYVAATEPANVQEVASGWAFNGWEGDAATRLQSEQYAADINGHAYGTSYMNTNGGSFMENLYQYGPTVNNGFPKPYIATEMGGNNSHTDLGQYSDSQTNAGAFDRDLRSFVAVADRFMQHATFFDDGGLNDYSLFAPVANWTTQTAGAISATAGVSGQDSRLQIYRRLALSYATHGTPLSYTLLNASALQYKDVYVRAVNTTSLAPLAGSGATSNKILISLVNDESTPETVNVSVNVLLNGTISGEVIGSGTTFAQADSSVTLPCNPNITLTVTIPARDSVEYILNQPVLIPPAAPTNLTATAISGARVNLAWTDNSTNEAEFVIERATDSGFTQNVTTITVPANTSTYADTGLSQLTTYYYQVTAVNSGGTSAGTNIASVTTLVASGWVNQDVGQPAVAGSASSTSGVITQSGSGTDIWGTSDSFNYWDNGLTGNAQISAQVNSISADNGWAKAGVMIRQNLTPGSVFAGVFITPGYGACFISRSTVGAGARVISSYGISSPYWVEISLSGSTLTGSISPNGTAWTVIGSVSIALTANAYIGLAVTAHDNTTTATATISNVVTSGNVATTAAPSVISLAPATVAQVSAVPAVPKSPPTPAPVKAPATPVVAVAKTAPAAKAMPPAAKVTRPVVTPVTPKAPVVSKTPTPPAAKPTKPVVTPAAPKAPAVSIAPTPPIIPAVAKSLTTPVGTKLLSLLRVAKPPAAPTAPDEIAAPMEEIASPTPTAVTPDAVEKEKLTRRFQPIELPKWSAVPEPVPPRHVE